ncbi:hypothetical protein [Ulvibacter antarcticus]|uniref:Uncharacterized protein n=1 Tax=Ulvibacter antarcticus TaxID=442714 RepID=A0A3L9Z671_9FLAO|nr:hypothetical protein [Ulvibacter antarcticus]RMA65888.1 hypothetical protein BXY75_0304 [Ulvibacter antarcticus]
MKKALFLLIVLCTTIVFSQDQPVEVPKIVVKVPMGETVQFQKASVNFIKVLEDSRCPTDVTCVWAGQVKILVEVKEKGKAAVQKEILFKGSVDTTLVASEGYKLKGVSLSPYPTSETQGKLDYVLLVSED